MDSAIGFKDIKAPIEHRLAVYLPEVCRRLCHPLRDLYAIYPLNIVLSNCLQGGTASKPYKKDVFGVVIKYQRQIREKLLDDQRTMVALCLYTAIDYKR